MNENKIKISEIFYSIQGEPLSIGKPVVFIRFPDCNLECTWCDTMYASRPKKWKQYSTLEIIKEILKHPTRKIVFTGGEPLLKKEEIKRILTQLILFTYGKRYSVEIETNGTIEPFPLSFFLKYDIHYNVSPKLRSSGNVKEKRFKPNILKKFKETNSIFKFVIKNRSDWEEAERIIKKLSLPKKDIWIMPYGATKTKWINKSKQIINLIIKKGYNFAPRLHVVIWDNKKGV